VHYLAALVLLASLSATAADHPASERPRIPYLHWGACLGECCRFGEWTAVETVIAYSTPSSKAAVVFRVRKGQRVRAITGVAITHQLGVTAVTRPVKLGYPTAGSEGQVLSLDRGAILYTLYYAGEGQDVFWYHRSTYMDSIGSPEGARDERSQSWDEVGEPGDSVLVSSRPKYSWWVKLRNRRGQLGWTVDADKFDREGCG
jgi:hypothetical protein